MGSHQRRTLGHFLLNLLDSKEVPGLEWIDRDQKRFKIPWMDKRNRAFAQTKNILVKRWEIFNNRYREGDPDMWTEWKQKFRGALNKSPYVKAIPELDQKKDPTMPYTVYQFSDAFDIHRPSSRGLQSEARRGFQAQPSLWQNAVSDRVPNSPSLRDCNPDIPLVVLDEMNNCGVFDSPADHTVSQNEDVQLSPSDSIPQSGDEFMDVDFANVPNGQLQAQQRAIPIPDSVPIPCPIPIAAVDTPLIKFEAYYFKNIKVREGFIGSCGVCLSSELKSETLATHIKMGALDPGLRMKIRGPDYFQEVELPGASPEFNEDVDKITNLTGILDAMQRGVLLYYVNEKLFVYRLCRTHVHASVGEENIHINRKAKNEQLLFDLNVYKEQLRLHELNSESNICPPTTVTLTFGTPRGREPIVHLNLIILEAEKMLREVKQDLLISGFDSGDMLLENLNSLTLGGNSHLDRC